MTKNLCELGTMVSDGEGEGDRDGEGEGEHACERAHDCEDGEGGGGDGGGGDGGGGDGSGGDGEGGGGDGEGEVDREGEGEGEGEGARVCAFAASAVETAIDAEAAAATDGAISAPNGSRPTARALVGQRACAARPREATDGADGRASEAGLSNLYKGIGTEVITSWYRKKNEEAPNLAPQCQETAVLMDHDTVRF